MAHSKCLEEAQMSTLCQFCEESPDIKWNCEQCNLFLCQVCNSKIHTKLSNSKDHRIRSIKDWKILSASDTVCKEDLQKIQCCNHPEKAGIMSCLDCEQSIICGECLIQFHQSHKLEEIDYICHRKIEEAKKFMSDIESLLETMCNEDALLQQLESNGAKMYGKTKEKITIRAEELTKLVQQTNYDLKNEIDNEWTCKQVEIKKEHRLLKGNIYTLKELQAELQLAMSTKNISALTHCLEEPLPTRTVRQIQMKQMEFKPVPTNKLSRSEIFGTVIYQREQRE